VNALGRVIREARQEVGEPSLRIDVVELGGGDQRVVAAARRPPSSEPANVQFLFPAAITRTFCPSCRPPC
jgi:hypothetical protein